MKKYYTSFSKESTRKCFRVNIKMFWEETLQCRYRRFFVGRCSRLSIESATNPHIAHLPPAPPSYHHILRKYSCCIGFCDRNIRMFRTHLISRFMSQLHLTLFHLYLQYRQVQLEKRGYFSPRSEKKCTPKLLKKVDIFHRNLEKSGHISRKKQTRSGKKWAIFAKFKIFWEKEEIFKILVIH